MTELSLLVMNDIHAGSFSGIFNHLGFGPTQLDLWGATRRLAGGAESPGRLWFGSAADCYGGADPAEQGRVVQPTTACMACE